jgi:hypothetical protein
MKSRKEESIIICSPPFFLFERRKYMTIKECIDIVDNLKPNQYTIKDKVMWLSFIEHIIINEVLKTHEGYDGRYDDFTGYSEDKLSVPLIAPSPYDRLYTAYLKMKIDGENGETARYNNSAALYNTYMLEYRKHYNKTHMPLDFTKNRDILPPKKSTSGLSEAEYENIKRDLTYILTEYFSKMTSDDKLSEIVTKYMQNNLHLFKGKDGYTPKKGVDYFTDDEITQITAHAEEVAESAKLTAERAETKANSILPSRAFIKILGGINNWIAEDVYDNDNNVIGSRYGQTVIVNNAEITPYSKVDLQIDSEQMVAFYEKDLAFVAENDGGVITVYCIGSVPQNDYTIQVTVTEVVIDA